MDNFIFNITIYNIENIKNLNNYLKIKCPLKDELLYPIL